MNASLSAPERSGSNPRFGPSARSPIATWWESCGFDCRYQSFSARRLEHQRQEAKSIGKRAPRLSIDVHLEQDPPGGVYFDPDRPDQLAEALLTLCDRDPTADSLGDLARQTLSARRLAFASTYEEIVREAVASMLR